MSVTKPIILNETGEDIVSELHNIAITLGGSSIATPQDIRAAARAGKAKQLLSIGQLFNVTKDNVNYPFAVMGFIENGVNGSLKIHDTSHTNGVIFQAVDCMYNLQFDAAEAFYYATSALAAGTYNFTIATAYSSWAAGTYQFTLANQLPAGGQLRISGNAGTALTSLKVNVFASRTATTYTEQCTITSGSGGTSLGTMDGTTLGHPQRVSYGNNSWKFSAIRQQLNSDDVAGSVWTPQHNWDTPPSWVSSMKGFFNGLDEDWAECIAETEVTTYRNTVTDGGGVDVTTDKVFLAGRKEVYMPTETEADTGVVWDFYKNNSSVGSASTSADTARIKKYNNSATYWWLRSPHVGNANNVRIVTPTGAHDYYGAYYSYGVAPAFVIA